MFERLVKANLTLNLAKCEFGQVTVTYLGMEVGQGQVRPVEAKVTAMTECPVPTTPQKVAEALGNGRLLSWQAFYSVRIVRLL